MNPSAPAAVGSPLPRRRSAWSVLGRVVLVLALLATVVVVMLWLFGKFHTKVDMQAAAAPEGPPAAGAALVAARMVRIASTEAASGRVTPVHEAEVASQIMQKVVAVNVKAGQAVKTGDVLVRLDETVLLSRLHQAQSALAADTAALTEAKAEEKRVRELSDRGIVSKSDLDHATAVLSTLAARCQGDDRAVAEAEATLKFATILAPMDGVVIDKRVEAGDMAKPGQVLVTLYDTMQVVANVRESLIHRLKEGQKVEVQLDRPAMTCEATVSEIVPEGDPVARTFPVKVVGPCKPGIRKGMYAKLIIPLDAQELLVIPQTAVTRIGQLDVVEVAENGRLHRRTVQLGRTLTIDGREMVQVLSGLREGEPVADRAVPKAAPADGMAPAAGKAPLNG